ncbi:MAG: hypothetical protein LBT59_28030 [Clostridiales bacterium]|jgi:hypothetical protein|nr:hypothetical protein [Clostridiales bacterium]
MSSFAADRVRMRPCANFKPFGQGLSASLMDHDDDCRECAHFCTRNCGMDAGRFDASNIVI